MTATIGLICFLFVFPNIVRALLPTEPSDVSQESICIL